MRTKLVIAVGGGIVLAALATTIVPSVAFAAKCYGAAARDPVRPCANPTRSIRPTLATMNRPTESPCAYRSERSLTLCTFGTPQLRAKASIALIGDSHAWHWRGALDVVARARRWQGHSLTASGCPFSDAVKHLPDGIRQVCVSWYRKTMSWLRRHREVSTVFVSQLNTEEVPLAVPAGQTLFGLRVAGFRTTFAGLPQSVKRVIVLRDVPAPAADTLGCIRRVLGTGIEQPGTACAMPRSQALQEDVATAAVKQLPSRRFATIDMTQYFCDAQRCFPVVGGALVYRDALGHMTVAYAKSLGPYLLRRVQIVERSR